MDSKVSKCLIKMDDNSGKKHTQIFIYNKGTNYYRVYSNGLTIVILEITIHYEMLQTHIVILLITIHSYHNT